MVDVGLQEEVKQVKQVGFTQNINLHCRCLSGMSRRSGNWSGGGGRYCAGDPWQFAYDWVRLSTFSLHLTDWSIWSYDELNSHLLGGVEVPLCWNITKLGQLRQ